MKTMILASAAALLAAGAWAAPQFTDAQLKAEFPADLGAETIDVSAYPKVQRDAYEVFTRVCSQCHTIARPINSGLTTNRDWKRFIERMHLRSRVRPGVKVEAADMTRILAFLTYDSHERKVEKKAAFAAERTRLKALYAQVKAERERREVEAARLKATKPLPPDGGASDPEPQGSK